MRTTPAVLLALALLPAAASSAAAQGRVIPVPCAAPERPEVRRPVPCRPPTGAVPNRRFFLDDFSFLSPSRLRRRSDQRDQQQQGDSHA